MLHKELGFIFSETLRSHPKEGGIGGRDVLDKSIMNKQTIE